MIKRCLTLSVMLVAGLLTHAQDFNVQSLTPSVLLPTGKLEIKTFHSNYTQVSFFDGDGNRTDNAGGMLYFDDGTLRETPSRLRNTFYTATTQFNYGLNSSINVGLEFVVNAGALSSSDDSRFSAIKFNQTAHTRTALSYVGAKIKFVPISSISNFSVQSGVLIPIAEDLQGNFTPQPFLNWDTFVWTNQFFLDIPLGKDWLLFTNIDAIWGVNRNNETTELQGNRLAIPLKALLNYFASNKLTLLLQTEYSRIWQAFGDEQTRSALKAYYLQLGPSVKYQFITGKLEGEMSYGYFLAGNNGQGAGNSVNLGLRLVL